MKIFLRILLIFLVFIIFIFLSFFYYSKKNIPELKEKILEKAKVSFDPKGVPLIESKSMEDGFSALGFPHTIHRRTQMELMKRFAQGRLSEIFGEKYLEIDKVMRIFNLENLSKETYSKFPSKILEDYARIVNETTYNNKMPILSRFINLKFEDWRPSDSYLILYFLIFDLNRNLKQELFFLKTAGEVSPEILKEIFHSSPEKNCIKDEEIYLLRKIPQVKLIASFDELHKFQHFGASNGIAIGKHLSKTGNPFLCIDPHLSKSFPPTWYISKIKISGNEICGVTIPGIPAVLIGHTDNIGWGFTSSLGDIIDLKIFKNLNLSELKLRKEVIKVKNKKDYLINYYEKDGDILISGLEEKSGVFLKFSRDVSSSPFDLFKKIYQSENIYDATGGFVNLPLVLNCIIIDKKGKLGHIISGKIPQRKGSSGFFPSEEIEWEGFINNYELFFKYDENFIISANEETNDRISKSWCAPYRYERFMELIPGKKWAFQDLKKLQRDVYSKQAEKILKIILKYFPEGNLKNKFQKWDLNLNENSKEAYLFEIFYYKFFENLLKDELGRFYPEYLKITPQSYPALDEAIFEGNENPLWDDTRTEKKEKMEDILIKTVKEMEEIRPLKWGKVHRLKIGYLFFSKNFQYPGDLNTINLGGFMPEIDHKVVILPSLRFIVEMKEKPECAFEIPGGQSEHLFDKNSKNFLNEFMKN